MTISNIEKLPESERAVTRASHLYYIALLYGASNTTKLRLRRIWMAEIVRRWPSVG